MVTEKLKELKLGKAAALVEGGAEETFSYYDFPPTHWRSIRTNNPPERINRELRRRTRVVGNLSNESSGDPQNERNLTPSVLSRGPGTGQRGSER